MSLLTEANRIGTAIHLKYIPAPYNKYKVIGRGATSIILEKDPHTVIVLTKDQHKAAWLIEGLGIATKIDVIDLYHPNPTIRNKDTYVLEMPMLHPLSLSNKRKIREELKIFDTMYYDQQRSAASPTGRKKSIQTVRLDTALAYMAEYPNGLLTEFFEHYINYNYENMYFDFF